MMIEVNPAMRALIFEEPGATGVRDTRRTTMVMAGRVAVRPAVTRQPSRQPPNWMASPVNGAATAIPAALAEFIQVLA
jgi:hypothetical protein